MTKLISLIGQQFGRWQVVARGPVRYGQPCWTCVCACGVTKDVAGRTLREGSSQSCGCLRDDIRQGRVPPTVHHNVA